jgi:hypothetical protein
MSHDPDEYFLNIFSKKHTCHDCGKKNRIIVRCNAQPLYTVKNGVVILSGWIPYLRCKKCHEDFIDE